MNLGARASRPTRNLLEEVGELVAQFLFTLRLCWLPLLISTVAICYGAPGLHTPNGLVGTVYRRSSTAAIDAAQVERDRRLCAAVRRAGPEDYAQRMVARGPADRDGASTGDPGADHQEVKVLCSTDIGIGLQS
jgi:hypothetical protein